MKKYYMRIGMIVGGIILIGLLFRYCSPQIGKTVLIPLTSKAADSHNTNDTTPSHAVASNSNPMAAFLDAFKTPIEFYGKVVDQHGKPVSGATVKLFPLDRPSGDQSNSMVTMRSDTEGKFSVTGLKGFSLGVQVTKEGYIYLSPLGGPSSSATISYANGASAGRRYSNPKTPLILTLQNAGPMEPMFYMEQTRWRLPFDGMVRQIALDSKDGAGIHKIEFRFRSNWNQLPMDNEINKKLFDWSFEARIPGGGFIWNDSDYNFEAPAAGYKESIRYDHPAVQPREKWKRFQHGRYFVKFADGSHGRIRFDIDGASDRKPLSMTSWLNLKPGSRNLASLMSDGSGFHGGNPDEE